MTASFRQVLTRHTFIVLLALLASGFISTGKGCKQVPPTVTTELGPETVALINGLKDENIQLKNKNIQTDLKFDSIAGSVYGINIGLQHVPGTPENAKGVDIISAENNLIFTWVGMPTPAQRAKADARTISILQNDLATKTALYGNALETIKTTNAQIDGLNTKINELKQKNIDQEAASKVEVANNTKKLQGVIDGYVDQIQKIKDEQAAKERKLWINTLRFGGFGIILLGVIAAAVTQGRSLLSSLILIGSGSLIILIGVAIDIVTAQWWFPYAAGIVGLGVLAGIGLFVHHIWQKLQFAQKATGVFNDIKTEAEVLTEKGVAAGSDTMNGLTSHLAYRFGEDWKKVVGTASVKAGLDAKKV